MNHLVSGKPSNRADLWAMTNKQASGIGHTLSASACFRIQAHQNMQSLLGFDSRINKHPGLWALLKCIRLSAHYRFIKFVPDIVACIAATAIVELEDCCSMTILEVWSIIELML
jgi:hypothetical protein